MCISAIVAANRQARVVVALARIVFQIAVWVPSVCTWRSCGRLAVFGKSALVITVVQRAVRLRYGVYPAPHHRLSLYPITIAGIYIGQSPWAFTINS